MLSPLIFICFGSTAVAQNNESNPIPITFQSHGDKIVGYFYRASGDGPFPTAILLHGFPGGEGDLFGLGNRLCREGFNSLVFNYRGTWKSEGIYLPSTSLEDVGSAIDFLKSSAIADSYSIDTANLVTIGYSWGGGMALLGSLFDQSVKRVIDISGGDLGAIARLIENSDEYRIAHQNLLDEVMSDSSVCRGIGGRKSHLWLLEHRDEFDLVKKAERISKKKILIIGGWNDTEATLEDHVLPIFRALRRYSPENTSIKVYDSDHSFEGYKEILVDDIVTWLKAK